MDKAFTEQDSIRIAEAAKNNITGEIDINEVECLTVCPILTAGALANPSYKRGGVACLGENCAFLNIDDPNSTSRECCVMLAGSRAALNSEYLEAIGRIIDKRL